MSLFTHCTALGRKVKLDDWIGFHRDRLLATLYSLRDISEESGVSFAQIADISGLPNNKVPELVSYLRERELVELTTIGSLIVMTERGVRWVEESPIQP